MLLAVGHFHYVADYLCDYSLSPTVAHTHMHEAERAHKHRINQGIKRKECAHNTHTHRRTNTHNPSCGCNEGVLSGSILTDFHQETGYP